MDTLQSITFSHQNIDVDYLGQFHIAEEHQKERLLPLLKLEIKEIIFLTTCNRVELLLTSTKKLTPSRLRLLLKTIYPSFDNTQIDFAITAVSIHKKQAAVNHWFRVASSLDSMVIGEREILGQMRHAYALCKKNGLNGDFMRILMQKTVETGKLIYTETEITDSPVSVVNLAYKKLSAVIDIGSKNILVVGAGKTNVALTKKLKKHGANKFSIYNRTLSKAKSLAKICGGEFFSLDQLEKTTQRFDVIITCTGSEQPIITEKMYNIINPSNRHLVVVDLAVPNDVSLVVRKKYPLEYISVNGLREIASKNLAKRKLHVSVCEEIIKKQLIVFNEVHKIRQIELAMREVPEKVKAIKKRAIEKVFVKEIEGLDNQSIDVLEKVMNYMEKNYMSTPMLMAKEILLKETIR